MNFNLPDFSKRKRLLLMFIPILIGGAIFIALKLGKEAPRQKKIIKQVPNVRVIKIAPLTVTPRGIGHGMAQPVRVWKAISQVSGKIIYTHPQLEKGKIIGEGAVVLRIDPAEYKTAVAQLNAKIKNDEAQVKQLQVERKNNLKLLEIQKKALELQRREVKRQKKLLLNKVSSATNYETQLKNLMSQELQVQTIQNSLNLYPVQKKLLETKIEQSLGDLTNAKLALSYTTIKAPFTVQVASVNNKTSEYIKSGATIFEANDISASEIEAQFVMGSLRPVIHPVRDKFNSIDSTNISSLGDLLEIKVNVRVVGAGTRSRVWEGVFSRLSGDIDTQTRTLGAIIHVNNYLKKGGGFKKRPLIKGMFCEVELVGKAQEGMIVIPRTAIHPGNKVYIADSDNKMEIRQVEPLYALNDIMVIKKGILEGDILILSDIVPAVPGIEVNPIMDHKTAEKIKKEAKGGSND